MITDFKADTFTKYVDIVNFVRSSGKPSKASTRTNTFPMVLNTKTLVVKLSTDNGATYPTTRTHTFGAGPYNTIVDVVTALNADNTFLGTELYVTSSGSCLVIGAIAPGVVIKVDATSTGIGGSLLQFESNQVANGSVTTIHQIVSDVNGFLILFYE